MSHEIHPVELTAHTLLSAPLNSLNDYFELLSQSQLILLTRLQVIEDRLKSFKTIVVENHNIVDDKDVTTDLQRIKQLRKRLVAVQKVLSKVNSRLDKIEERQSID